MEPATPLFLADSAFSELIPPELNSLVLHHPSLPIVQTTFNARSCRFRDADFPYAGKAPAPQPRGKPSRLSAGQGYLREGGSLHGTAWTEQHQEYGEGGRVTRATRMEQEEG